MIQIFEATVSKRALQPSHHGRTECLGIPHSCGFKIRSHANASQNWEVERFPKDGPEKEHMPLQSEGR